MRDLLMARIAIATLLALAACGDDASRSASPADTIAAWRSAGLTPAAFAPLTGEPGLGDTCVRGTVDGVDTTLCRYADDAAARAARPAGLAAIGETTGAALIAGPVLLVVADRQHVDPSGRTINRITRTFQGR